MTSTSLSADEVRKAVQQQAGKLLSQVAGFIGVRTVEIGLRLGLLEEIEKHKEGITTEALARQRGFDPFYVEVWCRSAYAAEVLELAENGSYTLASYMDKLLLDQDFPGYIGGLPLVIIQPEFFDRFGENLPSGKQIWWDECSPEFIKGVSGTGQPFYTRLIPAGLAKVSGLSDRLEQGARVLEMACGAGIGLIRLAETYPKFSIVGVDGDAYSLKLVSDKLVEAGIQERVTLVESTLEDIQDAEEYDMVLINISMHECRDIEKVTSNVRRALKPDGYFIISDFPFPDSTQACRTVPARIMCGIQFFEALIGDQLLPTQAYVDLLGKHGYRNVGAFDLTPVHAVTYGQK